MVEDGVSQSSSSAQSAEAERRERPMDGSERSEEE